MRGERTVADENDSKTTKRRLKAPTQTVREQAAKAQDKADKPSQRKLKASEDTKPSRVRSSLGKVFNRQPFRLIGKILVPPFVRGAISEVRQVTWPNRRETMRLTFAVIVFAIAFGIVVTGVDWVLDKAFKALIIN